MRSFYTIPVMARLAREAVRLFHHLEDEVGNSGGFHATGFTQLLPPDWVDIAREKVAMHRELGIDTELVPENEWQQRFPWANLEGVGAIVFERSSGYADPVQTAEAFVDSFVRAGGEFRPRTPVRALTGDAGSGDGGARRRRGAPRRRGRQRGRTLGNASGGERRPRTAAACGPRAGCGVGGAGRSAAAAHPGRERGRGGLHAPDGRRPVALRPRLPEALRRRGPLQLQGDVRQRLRGRRLPALVQADPPPSTAPGCSTDTPRSTT